MESIPIGRGFDTYLGYWSGAEDYYTHDTKGAYDFNDDVFPSALRPAVEFNQSYSTPIFTARAVEIISRFSPASAQPLFLYLPFQNVHWPLEAPLAYVNKFSKTTGGDHARNMVCAMASIMDDGIGNVTAALKAAGIFDNTIMIFSSDNGGPTHGNEGTSSNNFPLRGGKNTLWCAAPRGLDRFPAPRSRTHAHTRMRTHRYSAFAPLLPFQNSVLCPRRAWYAPLVDAALLTMFRLFWLDFLGGALWAPIQREGGTRVVGAIAGPGIASAGAATYEKMHAADWLPTLVSLASGQDWKTFIPATEPEYQYGDGIDVQAMLTSVGGKSPRNWLVYEAHPTLTEVRPAALPVFSNTVRSKSLVNPRSHRPSAPNWLLVA